MLKALSFLQKNLVWSIPVAMTCGLLFGYFFDAGPLKRFIIPVTFIMVYPMMVTLNVQNMFKGRDLKLQMTTQLINFILIPLLAFYTGKLFFGGEAQKFGLWAVGLFLIGVLPTSGMTISWTGFAKGNKEAAIKMVIFGLVLGALAAPVYTKIFMGATIDVDMLHMFRQIVLFVFVPLAAGLLTQIAAKKRFGTQIWNQRLKPKFPPFSALGVTLIAFLAMALKAKGIIANPGDIAAILLPLATFYIISYGFLSVIGRIFFKREDAVAMVFGVVMRDLSIALAIAMTAFGQAGLTIALLIALAYVIQIQSAAWYVRMVDLIFGKTDTGVFVRRTPAGAKTGLPIAKLPPMPPKPKKFVTPVPVPVPEIQKILYVTDLSETARHAARYACGLGHTYHAEVTLLHVIPDVVQTLSAEAGINLADHMGKEAWKKFHTDSLAKARAAIHQRISETSRQVRRDMPTCPLTDDKVIVKVGNPAQQILATAEEGDFNLIIMGTHGHAKFEEKMIGSTTRDVIRQSHRPVMVVRLPSEASMSAARDKRSSLHSLSAVSIFS
jgi:ACR3 family arsenite efflux pump ArsB/nucleotide-binding universal stress UspA family protein